LDQPFPISGDQIGVHVFRADWHSSLLDQPYKYHNPSADVILSKGISDRFWIARVKKLRCFASLNMTAGRIS
jgi:hypothetical protein